MSADRVPRAPGGPAAGDPTRSHSSSYGRGVRSGAGVLLGVGVLLLALCAVVDMSSVPRSVILGAGISTVSSAATVLVAAQMYRVAPAATAPALAALYLVKVLALGWFLLVPGTPVWLAPRAFAVTVLVCLVLALTGSAVLTHGVTRVPVPGSAPGVTSPAPDRAHVDVAAAPPVQPTQEHHATGPEHDHPTHERPSP